MTNTAWAALSQVARLGAQLVAALTLTRYLAPEEFGIVAMAAVAINLGNLFRDFGMGAAVVQRRELDQPAMNAIYAWNLVLGVILCGLTILLSPIIGLAFRSDEVAPVLIASAVLFPVAAFGSLHQAYLEREFRFRPLALLESAAAALSLLVAVAAARAGFGVYSLVAQSLVQCAVIAVGVRLISSAQVDPKFRRADSGVLLTFAGSLTGFNLANYLIRNADSFFIGRYLGSQSLGIYSMAMKMTLMPVQAVTQVIGRTLLPGISSIQDDRSRVHELYAQSVKSTASISALGMALAWAWREPLVSLLFGAKWVAVSSAVAYLAPCVFLQSIAVSTGTVHIAMGQTPRLLRLSLISATIFICVFFVGSQSNQELLLQLYLGAVALNVLMWTLATSKLLKQPAQLILKAITPAAVCGIGLAACVRLVCVNSSSPTGLAILLTAVAVGAYVAIIARDVKLYSNPRLASNAH